MPSLDWIGKRAVVNHHREVPTRLLHCDGKLSYGDPDAGNLLVQGDNLEALKALLPYYAGEVKCIYIDPPYNTGNEGWIYNDNVNSPEIRAWLNAVVGKEGEDLSRHDKWLCMMYPRLRLLKSFLRSDGAIFVSIDDNEVHRLRMLMDEIFGQNRFVVQIEWQKRYTRSNNTNRFTTVLEHIVVYSASDDFEPNLLARTDDANARYTNPDNDPRGPWKAIPFLNPVAAELRPNLCYPITNPNTGSVQMPKEKAWRSEKSVFNALQADGRLYWGSDGKRPIPDVKRFLTEVKSGIAPINFWEHSFAGHTDIANAEIKEIFGRKAFDTPKPTKLIERIFEVGADETALIVDSFAGSGTTGHAVLAANEREKLARKFILIEMNEEVATSITAKRLEFAVDRHGSGFRYCNLGKPIFDEWGAVNDGVTFADLAAFVFFSDTGSPIPKTASGKTPLLGTFQDRAIYMLFSPETLGVADEAAGNVLTLARLDDLPLPAKGWSGARVVYAEGCTVPPDRLAAAGVTFKQVPYQLAAS